MQFGYFDDELREYVITRPDTPLLWINYLGCEEYFGIISNTAGGYSFSKSHSHLGYITNNSILKMTLRITLRITSSLSGLINKRKNWWIQ